MTLASMKQRLCLRTPKLNGSLSAAKVGARLTMDECSSSSWSLTVVYDGVTQGLCCIVFGLQDCELIGKPALLTLV
jgi:hypothetical protein